MKLILDFDDVIFDTKSFKIKVFSGLVDVGVTSNSVESIYQKQRSAFNITTLYREVIRCAGIAMSQEELEKKIEAVLQDLHNYVDERLIQMINNTGKENCYILTAGEGEFQKQKLLYSGVLSLIPNEQIIIVGSDKKENLRLVCGLYPNEPIIFADDKEINIQDAQSLMIPNLFAVQYDERGFEKLSEAVSSHSEQSREVRLPPSLPMR